MTNDVSLVRSLPDEQVDVVGDVHGELEALLDLISHLGYRDDCTHPEGRRLAFLGDLGDRGHDSLAVVNLVKELVEAGKAACVLGNHDLNVLLNRRREGNDWFFDLPAEQQATIQAFFMSLPLALERPGLRLVHACWQDDMINLARKSDDVVALYEKHARLIEEANAADPSLDAVQKGLNAQNMNPVKLLTSGPEVQVPPFFKGGKWREQGRVEWWRDYAGPEPVLFGHYAIPADQPHLFGQAICLDYGVGYRQAEREKGINGRFTTRLAAFRWPEKVIVFDEQGCSLPL